MNRRHAQRETRRRLKEAERLYQTAVHEAGHAVSAFIFSEAMGQIVTVERVSVIREDSSLGRVVWKFTKPGDGQPFPRRTVIAAIVATMAGPAAEILYGSDSRARSTRKEKRFLRECGEPNPWDDDYYSRDAGKVSKLIDGMTRGDLEQLWTFACKLVAEESFGISCAAHELTKKREMTGPEFEAAWRQYRPSNRVRAVMGDQYLRSLCRHRHPGQMELPL